MKPTLFQFRFREPTAPTTTAPELKQVPAADVILKPPSIDDWCCDTTRSVDFESTTAFERHHQDRLPMKCSVAGRFGSTRITGYGYGLTSGDAFIDAIRNITPRLPEESRLKGF